MCACVQSYSEGERDDMYDERVLKENCSCDK